MSAASREALTGRELAASWALLIGGSWALVYVVAKVILRVLS